jgi:hypothetical protein
MAIIIRPNSGINNAMAGLAAGFGQGMQLGLQQEKLRMEQERINAILAREERQAILAEAADRRAETAANQQTQLFNLGMEQRQADAEAGGLLAATQQDFAMLQNPSLIPEQDLPTRLPEQSKQAGFEQSNQMTGERMQPYNFAASFNQMMAGLEKKPTYQEVRARYEQNMAAADKLAGYMSPEMRDMYMRETGKRNLLMADEAARQAFSSMLVDQRGRGFFQTYTPTGEPVEDPQITARLESLLEQAQNTSVPLQATQQIYDNLLEEVGKAKLKAQDFKFQMNRFDAAIANSEQMGQQSQALAFQALKNNYQLDPNISPQQMSLNIEKANQGMIGVTINSKLEWVNAATAKEDTARLQAESDKMRAMERENADLRNQLLQRNIGLAEAQTKYTAGRNQGFNLSQAYSTATRMYGQLSEDQKYALEEQGVTPDMWIEQMAQRLMSSGGGMPGVASTGAPSTPFGAMPGAQTVAGGNQQIALTPEIKQRLNREADELQLKGEERRNFAAWRLRNPQANPAEYKPAAPAASATPETESESKPPSETPAVQMTEEQAIAGLDRFKQLTNKPNKTLAEEVELTRLKKNAPEFQAALVRSQQARHQQAKAKKQLTDRQAEIKQDVLNAKEALATKKYSTGSARKELFGVPQSQEEFDLMMEYASENKGASTYVDDIGLLAQVMGFDVSKWSDKISVLSPEDLAIAKEALPYKSSDQSSEANQQVKRQSAASSAAQLKLVPPGEYREGTWLSQKAPSPPAPNAPSVEPSVLEQQRREKLQTQNMQRVVSMSETQLKKELVEAYGYDIRSVTELLKQHGSENIKVALAQIGQQGVGVGPAPKAGKQTQKNIDDTHRAQQAMLRSQLNARLRNQGR